MEIILLERVDNLGQMGDVVTVKNGYARNFLIPQKKALRANEANKERFEHQRADLEARNIERKSEAEAVAEKINGRSFVVIRQASEMGLLYGSVSTRDIAETASSDGVSVDRGQVRLEKPIKALGIVSVRVRLHPEVDATIEINVARSEEEAERQARGEDVLAEAQDDTEAEDSETTGTEFFDEDAQHAADEDGENEAEAGEEKTDD